MSRFDLVIFDYDGVIADSELLNNTAMAEVLCSIGLDTTVDQALELYMGKRWLDCRPLVEQALGRPCPETFIDDWTALCHERATTMLRPVQGASDFMAELGVPRCVASSSPPDWISMGLATMAIDTALAGPIFSAAVHVSRGKPDPDLFLHAATAMSTAPKRCLVIEDSVSGVQAAVSAGMTVVGLLAGGHIRDGHADRLRQAGADVLLDSYTELSRWIKNST